MRAPDAARRGHRFGLSGDDAEDYYDVVVSSEDESDASDAERETARNTRLNAAPQDEAERLAALSLSPRAAATPSAVLRHVGSIAYSDEPAARPAVKPVADDEFKLTDAELESHSRRKSALELALDAATGSSIATGEAPFRFAQAYNKPVTSPAPTFVPRPPGNAPQQSESAKRKPAVRLREVDEGDSDDDDELTTEPDPLYDEAMDDADEKWVQTNLREGRGGDATTTKTDATLCCPCCFVTVCMDCQRHVKYQNQYRAHVAMNCRVNRDEILTYATSSTPQSSHQLNSMTRRRAGSVSTLLNSDEYFGVVCSDCGTTVGVYDAQKNYHFFNVLPGTT